MGRERLQKQLQTVEDLDVSDLGDGRKPEVRRLLGPAREESPRGPQDDRLHGGGVATALRLGVAADGCEEREELVAEDDERGEEKWQHARRAPDDALEQREDAPDARVRAQRVHGDQLEVVLKHAEERVANRGERLLDGGGPGERTREQLWESAQTRRPTGKQLDETGENAVLAEAVEHPADLRLEIRGVRLQKGEAEVGQRQRADAEGNQQRHDHRVELLAGGFYVRVRTQVYWTPPTPCRT